MLSKRPMAFTEMLNVLRIKSSHLTYHPESLGELIPKAEDGSYKLSAFGETAVSTVGKVERAHADAKAKGTRKPSNIPMNALFPFSHSQVF